MLSVELWTSDWEVEGLTASHMPQCLGHQAVYFATVLRGVMTCSCEVSAESNSSLPLA